MELKLKAYLKKDNTVYDVLSFFSKFPDEEYRVFLDKEQLEWDVTNYKVDNDNVVLKVFSGVYDKNDMEIYSGDTIKAMEKLFTVIFEEWSFKLRNEFGTSYLTNYSELELFSRLPLKPTNEK
jgi:hypothetical protein